MSLMDNAKLPSLRDKIEAMAKVEVTQVEVKAVKKVKKEVKKKKNEK